METLIFAAAILITLGLIFTMVFFVISYSDLEHDYVNPFVFPENVLHAVLTLLLFLNLQLTLVLWNLPLLAFHYWQYHERRHWHDPTEIFRKVPQHKREAFIKLGFYLLSFFLYLYKMVNSLL